MGFNRIGLDALESTIKELKKQYSCYLFYDDDQFTLSLRNGKRHPKDAIQGLINPFSEEYFVIEKIDNQKNTGFEMKVSLRRW